MADATLASLTATTALSNGDLLYAVRDPGGTPLDRKITTADTALAMNAMAQAINAQTGTTYTLVNADAGKLVTFSSGGATTVTVGTALSLTSGQRIDMLATGAGQVTVASGGATLNGTPGLKLRAQYSAASLICLSSGSFVLIGDLSV